MRDNHMSEDKQKQADVTSAEQARRDLREAETGDKAAAGRLHQAEDTRRAAEAVEQEASDGPDKRGLSR